MNGMFLFLLALAFCAGVLTHRIATQKQRPQLKHYQRALASLGR